jgi:hypothetical protein
MKIYSLENTKRKPDGLYELMYPFLINDIDKNNTEVEKYIVPINREMRIDLICMDIYGNTEFIDELMFMNGIIDPYSIKMNDIIYYIDNIKTFQNEYKNEEENELLDKENTNNTILSKPIGLKEIYVDKNKNEIIIPNKLR